jgi:hypothetical protein
MDNASKQVKVYTSYGWANLKAPTEAVYQVNKTIEKVISEDDPYSNFKSGKPIHIGPNDDKMVCVFINRINYRYCCVYLVLQFSYNTGKLRLMAYGYDRPLPDLSKMTIEEQLCIPQGYTLSIVKNDLILERYGNTKIDVDHDIISNKLKNKDIIFFI